MSGDDPFHVEGVIVEVLQPGLFCVELSNGHRLLAYGRRRDRDWLLGLSTGQRVNLELSAYDLSKGRIRRSE